MQIWPRRKAKSLIEIRDKSKKRAKHSVGIKCYLEFNTFVTVTQNSDPFSAVFA